MPLYGHYPQLRYRAGHRTGHHLRPRTGCGDLSYPLSLFAAAPATGLPEHHRVHHRHRRLGAGDPALPQGHLAGTASGAWCVSAADHLKLRCAGRHPACHQSGTDPARHLRFCRGSRRWIHPRDGAVWSPARTAGPIQPAQCLCRHPYRSAQCGTDEPGLHGFSGHR